MNMLERPEIIKKQIEELNLKLKQSEEFYRFQKIVLEPDEQEQIGLINLGLARKIFIELNKGKTIKMVHPYYGEATIRMNPQRNVFIVKSVSYPNEINENAIINFILWSSAEWFVDTAF